MNTLSILDNLKSQESYFLYFPPPLKSDLEITIPPSPPQEKLSFPNPALPPHNPQNKQQHAHRTQSRYHLLYPFIDCERPALPPPSPCPIHALGSPVPRGGTNEIRIHRSKSIEAEFRKIRFKRGRKFSLREKFFSPIEARDGWRC